MGLDRPVSRMEGHGICNDGCILRGHFEVLRYVQVRAGGMPVKIGRKGQWRSSRRVMSTFAMRRMHLPMAFLRSSLWVAAYPFGVHWVSSSSPLETKVEMFSRSGVMRRAGSLIRDNA
jgi:hypothetical protein